MNDRTFYRESLRRKVAELSEHLENAAKAEMAADFEKMEVEDKVAGVMILLLVIENSGEEAFEKGYVGKVMPNNQKVEEDS